MNDAYLRVRREGVGLGGEEYSLFFVYALSDKGFSLFCV